MSSAPLEVAGSFRDPSGFVFLKDGQVYRQINRCYQEEFERLLSSGLFEELVSNQEIIPHRDVDLENAVTDEAYRVIEPDRIPFVSYPYEWCFSQLKHAALLTLSIQSEALSYGMSLKDASAYNIQFVRGKPVLIDTLSFEEYSEGQPWVAYRQFCQHFLAPLALMTYTDVHLHQLLRIHLDGLPLGLASRLLPRRTRTSFGLLTHIHLHAKAQERLAGKSTLSTRGTMGQTALLGLLDSLKSTVNRLAWQPGRTEWHNYYEISSYSDIAMKRKRQIVADMLERIQPLPASAWDLGANTGLFSRIVSDRGIATVCFDIDPAAVESNYLESVKKAEVNILPLVLDLANPSPAIGWANSERMSLLERAPADVVLALALVHHLAISNNVPLERIAHFLSRIGNWLIIEFVPKSDSQARRLLASRKDIFVHYDQDEFESVFKRFYKIVYSASIADTSRTLYLMKKT